MSKIKVFCLPFAGGSKVSYRGFETHAGPHLEIIPLEPPGRGTRYKEPRLTTISAMADDFLAQVKPFLHQPYFIFGHSMGAMAAYELTRKIGSAGENLPLHLVLSGRRWPGIPETDPVSYNLPKTAFLAKVRELGGSPDELLNDAALMDFFEPILRTDFQAVETYQYQPAEPMPVPVTVLIGTEEGIPYEDAYAWKAATTSAIEVRQFPGNHFFLLHHEKEIIRLLDLIRRKTMQTYPA